MGFDCSILLDYLGVTMIEYLITFFLIIGFNIPIYRSVQAYSKHYLVLICMTKMVFWNCNTSWSI